jgi:hypothetical protein
MSTPGASGRIPTASSASSKRLLAQRERPFLEDGVVPAEELPRQLGCFLTDLAEPGQIGGVIVVLGHLRHTPAEKDGHRFDHSTGPEAAPAGQEEGPAGKGSPSGVELSAGPGSGG